MTNECYQSVISNVWCLKRAEDLSKRQFALMQLRHHNHTDTSVHTERLLTPGMFKREPLLTMRHAHVSSDPLVFLQTAG